MPDISFTRQSFETLTLPQVSAIQRLVQNDHTVEVGRDFSLPEGWLFFVQSHGPSGAQIQGGISPEGDTHT